MARGAEKQAKETYADTKRVGGVAEGRADDAYGTLMPMYKNMATNPQGFDAADLTAMNTAAQESSGGALSSVTGEANQMAARNRNMGGYGDILAEVSRSSMRDNASKALGVKVQDAMLKEANRGAGREGLQTMYGGNADDVMQSLGIRNDSTKALTEAGKSGWFQNMLGFMNAAANVATAASGVKTAWK